MLALTSVSAFAGGLLTNTNQSVDFLRNPARDAAIGIDGVYSNPAGVAFLSDGLHLAVNWQSAWQTRTVHTTNPLYALGIENNGETTKKFKGDASAPFIPSVQAAYNTGRWSFQFCFSVTGGGGKCEFDNGLGTFETAVAQIAYALNGLGVTGYSMDSYLQGRQYYFGFTLGAAYKVTDNLSVYGGVRIIYGNATYKAKVSNINVVTTSGTSTFSDFLDASSATVAAGIAQLQPLYEAYGENIGAENVATYQTLLSAQSSLSQLDPYRNGINMQSDQHGVGWAPLFGIDYKIGAFNFAAKYEFRTKMSMKNKSTVDEVSIIDAVNQYIDGTSVREDSPALLAFGAQWSALPNLRINAGYHHFYDKQSKKYNDEQELLDGGTNEYLGGIEWDPTNKLTVSGGFQITRYGLSDEFMNDISFVVNSWTFGLGAKYKFNDKVALNVAYFQTNYGDYDTATDANGVQNSFTRTNNVAGVGVEFTL